MPHISCFYFSYGEIYTKNKETNKDMRYGIQTCGMALLLALAFEPAMAQNVDYSVASVPEESGTDFTKITQTADYVCMPEVKRSNRRIDWLSNRILDISTDGRQIAYLSFRNNTTNIFIKDLDKQGPSIQKTNRTAVLDFSYSPDGKHIVFSETRGKTNQIFQTAADKGFVCRQVTTGNNDYSPVYSADMKSIFFARQENRSISIWSYDMKNNFLANYSQGMNPYPVKGERAFICVRNNAAGHSEIWKVNYETGVEECIVSQPDRDFTSPSISPDGQWLLFVGSSKVGTGSSSYYNTDLFVSHLDGTAFTQLTYHAADDLSPVWSKDGRHIYFVSQRGDKEAKANIWRMTFNY